MVGSEHRNCVYALIVCFVSADRPEQ
uniref:Uncharacterized protein n=1 Tax=Rhizophora mucronata TaxID=61149 RepID=A0A2P2PVP2_RHIMU